MPNPVIGYVVIERSAKGAENLVGAAVLHDSRDAAQEDRDWCNEDDEGGYRYTIAEVRELKEDGRA